MKISPARIAAFEILRKVENESAFSSVLLSSSGEKLSDLDRGLCHELTLGVLRRKLYFDYLIDHLAEKKRLDLEVRISIWLGLYQIIFLDRIPAHAAINDSVNLVKKSKKSSAAGFVNAILRRAARDLPGIEAASKGERTSIETSHPKWLIERWVDQLGPEEAEKLASINNLTAPAAFRLIDDDVQVDEYRAHRSQFVNGCYVPDSVSQKLVNFAREGQIFFQDEASQLVGQAVDLEGKQSFIDVCASPGSKTTQIARRFRRGDISFVAGDKYTSRLATLRKICRQQHVEFVNTLQYDAAVSVPFEDESFDVVLVDAPCSGTGTIRQNPEIRYRLGPEDIFRIASEQRRILSNASKLVRIGGTLIYSTCSIEPEENEEVCSWLMEKAPSFELVRPNVPERFLTVSGFARTFPHRDNMEGFFIAAFVRK